MGIFAKIRSLFSRKSGAPDQGKAAPPPNGGASSSKGDQSRDPARRSRQDGKGGKPGQSEESGQREPRGTRGSRTSRESRESVRNGEGRASSRPPRSGEGRSSSRSSQRSESFRSRGRGDRSGGRRSHEGRSTIDPSVNYEAPTIRKAEPLDPNWTQEAFAVEPQEGRVRFHDLGLPREIMAAIADLGFEYCTPIQAASLQQTMDGKNVAGRAQTGTGKTAAYLVAILTRYLRTPDRRNSATATPRALVIAPTRELCVQICLDAQALGKYCGLNSVAIYGGMDYAKQQSMLSENVIDLVAATPGRLLDFARHRVIDLSKIDTLVIDEADRMLDMGFIPDVRRIIGMLPKNRQTLLFSATLDGDVMRLASQWMPDPVKIEIEPEHTANDNIEQKVLIVTSKQKFTVLCNLLKKHEGQRVLIFGNRRMSTDSLAERLRRCGFPCELLSGDVSQERRMRVLEAFKSGSVKTVVATDVAGRGLHIADIGLVVNFELPYEAEDYVHRIGRTGRAGKVGTAVSFADEDESFVIPDIEKYLGEELKTTMLDEDDPLLKN